MKKRKLYLEGEIAEKFGSEFTVSANSFSDAMRCLDCNIPEFRAYLIEAVDRGINFTVHINGKPVTDDKELLLNNEEGDMVLAVLPAGAKSGGAKILAAIAITFVTAGVGAVMLGANASLAAGLSFAAATVPGQIALGLAVNLALQGFQQIMAPDPSVDDENAESYMYQGTGQTSIEGDPVPILYGQLRIPGRPISVDIRNTRQTFTNAVAGNSNRPIDIDINTISPGVGNESYGQTYTDYRDYQEEYGQEIGQ